MARRTKNELTDANYYNWLAHCDVLRKKKKDGVKLSSAEKMLLRTIPSPETPYSAGGDVLPGDVPPVKKKPSAKKTAIDFDRSVVWPVRGAAFLCAVFNVPYTDEQCMLFCERDDCPFHGHGYFRAHGVQF